MQQLLDPLVVSWGWGNEKPHISRFVDEHQDCGTRDPAAYLAVPVAMEFMHEREWPTVRHACHALVRYARTRITALTGLDPITPDTSEWYGQIAAFPLPECDVAGVSRQLRDRFGAVVPIFEWQGQRLLRLSVQAHNTVSDVDALVGALASLLCQAEA